jgi:endonuclease III
MKQGSEYAKRIKRLLGQLVRKFGKPELTDPVDPIDQLIIGILAGCTTHARAVAVYKRLRHHVVDLNELRVTPAMELAEQIGDGVPLARQKAQRIVDALNAIRKRQDSLDLTFLKQRGRREAREYLEALEGVDRATAASVVLFSLGGHAIPLDGLLLYVLQKEELVDPSAEPAEVQSFLERCVNSSQAQVFYELLSRYAASKSIKVPYERLGELLRPPPAPPPPVPAKTAPVAASSAKAGANGKAAPAVKTASSRPAPARPAALKGDHAPEKSAAAARKPADRKSEGRKVRAEAGKAGQAQPAAAVKTAPARKKK